ncbi:MAG: diguanylate cyclase domain-containing protein [Blautia marasmi]
MGEYRIGGDEFLILLRHLQSIRTWEENLKEAQEKYNSEHEVKISIAAGLATGRKAGESDKWLHELVEQADKNMYENKNAAGNKNRGKPAGLPFRTKTAGQNLLSSRVFRTVYPEIIIFLR